MRDWKDWRLLGVVFILLLVMGMIGLFFSLGSPEQIQQFAQSLGAWGPLGVGLYLVASHVFAPLSGMPGVIAGFALYGAKIMIIFYVADLISATINFYISRKLGRKWVRRLSGKQTLKKIDRIKEKTTTRLLMLGRLVGFPLFDVISYAAGLTKMGFWKYFRITAFYTIPSIALFTWAFYDMDVNLQSVSLFAASILAISLASIYIFHKVFEE